MSRSCLVCLHPRRAQIDRALAAGRSYREISRQFAGLGKDTLCRHKADHLLPDIVRGWQEERQRNGAELRDQLDTQMAAVTKVIAACDAFLTDPHDADRYDLGPRTTDVWVVYEVDRGPDRRPERRKERLSALLARIDGHEQVGQYLSHEAKIADPRKLILDASKTAEGHLRLLGELLGKLTQVQEENFLQTPAWRAVVRKMMRALDPYPDARFALADALSGDDEGEPPIGGVGEGNPYERLGLGQGGDTPEVRP